MNIPATAISRASNSGLAAIVDPGTAFEQLLTGFEFVEGPAWHPRQNALVFSDIIDNTMYRWHKQDGLAVLRNPSHMTNGNTWDREGRLLSCEHATSRISRSDPDGNYEVLVSHYAGCELNSPNDIVVKKDGGIYFTDPNSGRTEKYGVARYQELDFQGVFRFDPETSELTMLERDFAKPNGLCFSLDESLLFVNDTDRQHIRVFDVLDNGNITNGRSWAETDGDKPGVADGMKIDCAGNLYCCGSGGIHVFDPDGTRIGVITTPEVAANFTWGGDDLTDLYITATHSIYRLRVKTPGYAPFIPANGESGR
ncbi:MAG: SMP-30/gluconolactonase/LRE family protein [Gammaproteobacteria bacterium]|nr:SMP-30/gluconolactonase/LRE family protein [Gammaproteobacteria bacterium]